MFSYTVRCSISNAQVAEAWLDWLKEEHIQDVLDAGAIAAEVFKMGDESVFEIRYRFLSKTDFEKYESQHAPRLRQEGLSKFPLELGLSYSRSTAERIGEFKK